MEQELFNNNDKLKELKEEAGLLQCGKGNPKTLTPGPRTSTMARVHGLPEDRSTDYPYGPLNEPPPK